MKRSSLLAVLFSTAVAPNAIASVWIDANDLYLRNHIQNLADANLIKAPVTTYPLMWDAIDNDLLTIDSKSLSPSLTNSYAQVLHYYRQAQSNRFKHSAKISLASDPKRLSHFGNTYRQKAQLSLNSEHLGSFWAARLSTQIRNDAEDDKDLTFDDSYLAVIYKNWIIRAGAISQWWGPGWNSSLIMSNNARPLPALSLTRSDSQAFESPWLNWIGPWTFTAQMAKLESDRKVPNALLWSTRATARPFPSLELGASWSIQWGGNGQPNGLSDFFNALTSKPQCINGASSCDSALHTKHGNQLAGIDLRWTYPLFGKPVSLYAQTIGEDAVGFKPVDKAYTYGVDTSITLQHSSIRLYVEYTDTQVTCGSSESTYLNCYYNHSTYKTGYRYHGRSIGASLDNDSEAISVGFIGQTENNHQWHLKLMKAKLNSDGIDGGNLVTPIAEDLSQVDMEYQLPLFRGMLNLNVVAEHSTFQSKSSRNDFNVSASWEYRY